jgi:hypothetical protein
MRVCGHGGLAGFKPGLGGWGAKMLFAQMAWQVGTVVQLLGAAGLVLMLGAGRECSPPECTATAQLTHRPAS